jgi:hypothetical protein
VNLRLCYSLLRVEFPHPVVCALLHSSQIAFKFLHLPSMSWPLPAAQLLLLPGLFVWPTRWASGYPSTSAVAAFVAALMLAILAALLDVARVAASKPGTLATATLAVAASLPATLAAVL